MKIICNVGSLAAGAGAVLLAPVLLPMFGGVLRPVLKAVIKAGLIAYEGAKVSIAETREGLADIAAEAKSEVSRSS
ncbi:MAG: DUF5132 domain-containing protein [Desulfobacteraceae bacterium]|jgi:hypothetical protein|nr:DUF5132 domain-containing protein [Desulfobacteraceae bacterium]